MTIHMRAYKYVMERPCSYKGIVLSMSIKLQIVNFRWLLNWLL